MGKSLDRYLSPTGVEVWRNVKCRKKKKKKEGVYLIYWPKQPGEGREHLCDTFDSFSKPIRVKNLLLCYRMCLSVGAPVRVYLHSLVRRLLYSHLTPSTLSSPSLTPVLSPPVHSHPDTPSPPTTSLHGWLCLVLRSMHVCCFPWQTPQFESLFSLPPWAAEARRHPDAPTSENKHTCRGSHSWGWQGTVHKHSFV